MKAIPTLAAALLALAVGQTGLGRAGQGTLAIEPIPDLSQETRKPIQFTLTVKGAETPKFTLAKVVKDGETLASPKHIALDAEKGTFSWTPTPSQAGKYELTITAKDAKGDATTTVKIIVRPGPITTNKEEIGKLLLKWHAEGTAAGNTGDFYDNRDGDHSPLNLGPWPQLDQVIYTAEDRKLRRDWAAQGVILPHVTFGNSSTSAPPTTGGSNVRSYYAHPQGIPFLYRQYLASNVYIYPEHRDHDPGHNGKGDGYGDTYPANTPFLLTSQGSSGSDQPFMRAIPYTLAAFRPEVKKKLVENGLLMPTLQMIFRMSNKHITDPKQYLTGKAHPTVFEGSWVNDLKMVQLAHEIQTDNVPPLVQLRVVEEDLAVEGKDFFDPGKSEKHVDTPVVISRIVRGPAQVRKMVVSAEASLDVNKKPLTYHWVVLRGDPERIKIIPKKDDSSVVELQVPYHDRFTIKEPVPIETNRVDIGVFVHNGAYHSAPAFVTFYSLDLEARTYDDKGRLLEIGHGAGEADVGVSDWNAFFALLRSEEAKWPVQLLQKQFKPEERTALARLADEYKLASDTHRSALDKTKLANEARQKAQAVVKAAEEKVNNAKKALDLAQTDANQKAFDDAKNDQQSAEEARKAAEATYQAAQKVSEAAGKSAADLLTQKRDGLDKPARALVEQSLARIKDDPNLFLGHGKEVETLLAGADAGKKNRFIAARKRLAAYDLVVEKPDGTVALQPIRAGAAAAADRLTRYERNLLERFHAELLADLIFPGVVTQTFRVNYVDMRIATPRSWRDVYRYDDKGALLGWTRYDGETRTDLNADGFIVLEKDVLGRALKARAVRYFFDDSSKNFWSRTLKQAPGNQAVTYQYEGPDDRKGKIISRETIEDKKP